MTKEQLKAQLIILIGEMKADIENENGCCDEIAEKALNLAFECKDLLDKSSNDKLIQFDKSIEQDIVFIDGVFIDKNGFMCITETDKETEEIYNDSIEVVDRENILKILEIIEKMC